MIGFETVFKTGCVSHRNDRTSGRVEKLDM